MATADDLLRQGDLDGARKVLVEAVRARPSEQEPRMFLFQLLALAGEWDKAKTQLQTLATLSPEAQMLSVAYGQAIEAERVRAQVFAGKAAMPLLHQVEWAVLLAESIVHFAAGRVAEGESARDAAFDAAPEMPGTLDGVSFEWIADADARFGPAFEAIINGRYGLVPFDVIESIKSNGAQDLRDLIWYPATIAFRHGQSIAAMLPVRYPGSEHSNDNAARLARTTTWIDTPAGQIGQGQRLWTLSSGEDRDLLSLRTLVFG